MNSILSASMIIGAVLSDKVASEVTKIFPVVAAKEAVAPYICYRRVKLEGQSVKGYPSATAGRVEVLIFTSEYSEGVMLAEKVKDALDGCSCRMGDLTMRSCRLVDAAEDWGDDVFAQQLLFEIRI